MGEVGHLRLHHQAARRGRDHRQDPGRRTDRGDYKFTDEFPMADGFEENAEFFTLTYETPVAVSHNMAFARIAPLLWMRRAARQAIENCPIKGWDVADTYGLLMDLDKAAPFIKAVEDEGSANRVHRHRRRPALSGGRASPARARGADAAYESYLTNFGFAIGDVRHEVHAEGLSGRSRQRRA